MRLSIPPAFKSPLRRPIYAACAGAALALQYAVVVAAHVAADQPLAARLLVGPVDGRPASFDVLFWLIPLRALAALSDGWPVGVALACVFGLTVSAALAWLSFRRATDAGRGFVLAPLAVVPALQLVVVLVLVVLPSRAASRTDPPAAGVDTASVIQGLLAGVGLVVFGVALSALVFRAYGSGMFLLTPCLVGVTTAYVANRRAALTLGRTLSLVMSALAVSGLALLALALEGLICIVMAAPLAAAMAVVGALIGRALALAGRRRARPAAMSVAVLPLVFALEAVTPPAVVLDTHETVDIAASPAQVWAALTDDAEIPPPSNLLFRLGLAYPVRGELRGEGVGAERIGVFSTGEARERITDWSPERRLAFVVLTNPPLMDEFSPHAHVHAPHVDGYFETGWTRFDLQPLPGGRTRLTERASHTLRLDPVLYWAPLIRWGIDQNNARALGHIRAVAEANATPRPPG